VVRRATQETPPSHERWLVSYADFITLLFAFFVVMYSVSSVNEGKYRILTETLEGVFHTTRADVSSRSAEQSALLALHPHNERVIELPLQTQHSFAQPQVFAVPGDSRLPEAGGALSGTLGEDALAEIDSKIQAKFADLIALGQIQVSSTDAWIEVDIKSNILFESGRAEPSAVAQNLISGLAGILSEKPNPVHVEGFTDNLPIDNEHFPSNWELSTARASSVLRLLVDGGVAPSRLAAVGYAQYQPIASNDTSEGRRKNRRVVLVISKALNVRRSDTSNTVNRLMPLPEETSSVPMRGKTGAAQTTGNATTLQSARPVKASPQDRALP